LKLRTGRQELAVNWSTPADWQGGQSAVSWLFQEEPRRTAQENQSSVSAVHTNTGLQPWSRSTTQGLKVDSRLFC